MAESNAIKLPKSFYSYVQNNKDKFTPNTNKAGKATGGLSAKGFAEAINAYNATQPEMLIDIKHWDTNKDGKLDWDSEVTAKTAALKAAYKDFGYMDGENLYDRVTDADLKAGVYHPFQETTESPGFRKSLYQNSHKQGGPLAPNLDPKTNKPKGGLSHQGLVDGVNRYNAANPKHPIQLGNLDTNKDGILTLAEALAQGPGKQATLTKDHPFVKAYFALAQTHADKEAVIKTLFGSVKVDAEITDNDLEAGAKAP